MLGLVLRWPTEETWLKTGDWVLLGTCLDLGDPGVDLGEDEGEEEEGLNGEEDSEGEGGEGG